jgi:hypothetical protein
MPGAVYALAVGIDAYLPPVNALYGCKNDVTHVVDYLQGRLGDRLHLQTLLDREATRAAIIDAFRTHLAPAGASDVALFYFSGHGMEEPSPPEFAALDPTGRIQVLVCSDTGRRVEGKLQRGLADKELAALIRELAPKGAHIVIVLDCCHSGSGTRDPFLTGVRQWKPDPFAATPEARDLVAEIMTPRSADDLLPSATAAWGDLGARGAAPAGATTLDHIALSACQSFELAKEQPYDGETRGTFSVALVSALQALGERPTYRSLLATVRSRVERAAAEQTPVLFPLDVGGPADGLVLDGSVIRSQATFRVTRTADGFEVDAGSVHGLTAPTGGEEYRLTCLTPGGDVAGEVRVVAVQPGTAKVEPVGWVPEDIAYDAVVTTVPLPPARVRFDPTGADEADALVRSALATFGPGGTPSPFVVENDGGSSSEAVVMRVAAHADGYDVERTDGSHVVSSTHVPGACFRILRLDGTPITADVSGIDAAAAKKVVGLLEHVARWEQLRGLGDHESQLRDAIRLEMFLAEPGETSFPVARPPLTPSDGYRLEFQDAGAGWVHPTIFMQLVNTTDRDLYVALLDLNDTFGIHASLFPTARLAAHRTVRVWEGQPIPVTFPEGRLVAPGAMVKDWLQIVVSEVDFDSSALEMPALDEPATRSAGERSIGTSTIERLAARALTRAVGAGGPPPRPADWAVSTIPLITAVPSA